MKCSAALCHIGGRRAIGTSILRQIQPNSWRSTPPGFAFSATTGGPAPPHNHGLLFRRQCKPLTSRRTIRGKRGARSCGGAGRVFFTTGTQRRRCQLGRVYSSTIFETLLATESFDVANGIGHLTDSTFSCAASGVFKRNSLRSRIPSNCTARGSLSASSLSHEAILQGTEA